MSHVSGSSRLRLFSMNISASAALSASTSYVCVTVTVYGRMVSPPLVELSVHLVVGCSRLKVKVRRDTRSKSLADSATAHHGFLAKPCYQYVGERVHQGSYRCIRSLVTLECFHDLLIDGNRGLYLLGPILVQP